MTLVRSPKMMQQKNDPPRQLIVDWSIILNFYVVMTVVVMMTTTQNMCNALFVVPIGNGGNVLRLSASTASRRWISSSLDSQSSDSLISNTTATATSKTCSSTDGDDDGSPIVTIIPDPPRGQKAYPQQPPHSGRHFTPTHPTQISSDGNSDERRPARSRRFSRLFQRLRRKKSDRRFFEGWYYRLTLPDTPDRVSFAFIYSIEDPFLPPNDGTNGRSGERNKLSLACHQIMGPNDEYLVEGSKDHTKFWAWEHQQGVGCRFGEEGNEASTAATAAMDPDEFMSSRVKSGFQFTPHRLQGKLCGQDGKGSVQDFCEQDDKTDAASDSSSTASKETCEYDMHITPITGWGDEEQGQKSTAGWLANYGVFEPHWQVTQSDGRATGYVTWKGQKYEFKNAPFYAEKNWGGAFPIKWFWCQCNSFNVINSQQVKYHTAIGDTTNVNDGSTPPLSVTAGGGTRKLPLLRSKESLGMVSVHYNGTFYEATPWLGTMEWEISDWGYWKMTGRCTGGKHKFYAELEAVCDAPGVKLRAPTEKDGMVYFCRDSFLAEVTLKLSELVWDDDCKDWVVGDLIVEATSSQAAVEIGGGPWWDYWKGRSIMKQPMKELVRLPYRFANVKKRLRTLRRK